jgi:myo-inositol-1(or 4)-monophosphatase
MSDVLPHHELTLTLARSLREVVLPHLGSHAGRVELGTGAGGDPTFSVDQLAETMLSEFVADRAPRFAFYSEDRGLVAADGDATHVLVVDPIDGTRPAMAGLESACVAVALAPLDDGAPTMADVEVGCVVEIKSGDWFLARRGEGLLSTRPVRLSQTTAIGSMFWAYGFRGRPARATAELLATLIDSSSVGGGTFELGSQAFGMTRIATGQLDAVIEVGSRMIDEVPGMAAEFLRVGRGAILNNSPYDLAGPWLCLVEAGGVVSDGWGEPLDSRPLLGAGHEYQMSSISAANRRLHERLVAEVDAGIERLRTLAA